MSGYQLLRSLGHRCTRLRPNLVQVKTGWAGVVSLKGVRANCRAQILHNGVPLRQSVGELQFTECGLSGPVMFELSRDVCQEKGSWVCRLDFLPEMDQQTLLEELQRRRETQLPKQRFFYYPVGQLKVRLSFFDITFFLHEVRTCLWLFCKFKLLST